MPHGFFTLERWSAAQSVWKPVAHFTARQKISHAIAKLESLARPGFYRITQTQRMIWAEKINGKLKLRIWHAGTPEVLARGAAAFTRDRGKWPSKPTRKTR